MKYDLLMSIQPYYAYLEMEELRNIARGQNKIEREIKFYKQDMAVLCEMKAKIMNNSTCKYIYKMPKGEEE